MVDKESFEDLYQSVFSLEDNLLDLHEPAFVARQDQALCALRDRLKDFSVDIKDEKSRRAVLVGAYAMTSLLLNFLSEIDAPLSIHRRFVSELGLYAEFEKLARTKREKSN